MNYRPKSREFKKIQKLLNMSVEGRWVVNSDNEIDVDGNVNLRNCLRGMSELPIEFGTVTNIFDCGENTLTTLKGSPKICMGDFYCDSNLLTSLDYLPNTVSDIIVVSNNPLKDYFKNIKEEDFPHWGHLEWDTLDEYPFLINIFSKYNWLDKSFLLNTYPMTKLYYKG